MAVFPFITFLSDYGTADELVGVCHAVIARLAPSVRVIDLGHGHRGIRAAAAALAQAVPYTPEAVHLAVVDPGVGTQRRAVAVVTASGRVLVGPDNGLLAPAADRLGGVVEAYELAEPSLRLDPVSATFHGRDIFAPAAALIARGVPPASFGPPVPDLVRLPPPRVVVGDGLLEAEVLRADAFGNLQTAARPEDLAAAGFRGEVLVGGQRAVVGRTFADAAPGELVVYVDSAGQVAVAVNGASAAQRLGHPESVHVRRAD